VALPAADLDAGGRIILKLIGVVLNGLFWVRRGMSEGCCEHGNELSVSMKY
jgi:hypothetical protein